MIVEVDAIPMAMPRPRVSSHGRVYYTNHSKIVAHKQLVKDKFFEVARKNGCKDDIVFKDAPVIVYLKFTFPIPKSDPKWLKEDKREGKAKKINKPDIDNLIKTYLDALNPSKDDPRGAWHDDAQVYSISAKKTYGDEPKIEIMITEKGYGR